MDIKRNSPRDFFGRTKAMFGERMEDYARTARESYPNDQTNFEELEQFRQEKRDSEDKRKFIFRIATVEARTSPGATLLTRSLSSSS